jgi:hypothetical protein
MDILHKQSTKIRLNLKHVKVGLHRWYVLPIKFNIPAFENPEDRANYISLLKQIGYSKEDLEQITRKMPNIAEKMER